MQNKLAAAVVSFGLVLGMAAMTENSVMAQQAVSAAQPDGKAEVQTVKTAQTNSKTIHVPAESQQAERKAPAENSKPQPTAAAAETAKVFP